MCNQSELNISSINNDFFIVFVFRRTLQYIYKHSITIFIITISYIYLLQYKNGLQIFICDFCKVKTSVSEKANHPFIQRWSLILEQLKYDSAFSNFLVFLVFSRYQINFRNLFSYPQNQCSTAILKTFENSEKESTVEPIVNLQLQFNSTLFGSCFSGIFKFLLK